MGFLFASKTSTASLFLPYTFYIATFVVVFCTLVYGRVSDYSKTNHFYNSLMTSIDLGVKIAAPTTFLFMSLIAYINSKLVQASPNDELRFSDVYGITMVGYTGVVLILHGIFLANAVGKNVKSKNMFAKALTGLNMAAYAGAPVLIAVFVGATYIDHPTIIESAPSVWLQLTTAIMLFAQVIMIALIKHRSIFNRFANRNPGVVKRLGLFKTSFVSDNVERGMESHIMNFCIFMLGGYLTLYRDQVQAAIAFGITIGIPFCMMYVSKEVNIFIPMFNACTFAFYSIVFTVSAFSPDSGESDYDANAHIMVLAPRDDTADAFIHTITTLVTVSFVFALLNTMFIQSPKRPNEDAVKPEI